MAMERAGYKFEPENWDAEFSFVPISVLYQTYRNFIASKTHRHCEDPPPDDLNIRSFGAALRHVWTIDDLVGENEGTDVYRTRRWYHGKQQWGYLAVTGPEALNVQYKPGRPSDDSRIDD